MDCIVFCGHGMELPHAVLMAQSRIIRKFEFLIDHCQGKTSKIQPSNPIATAQARKFVQQATVLIRASTLVVAISPVEFASLIHGGVTLLTQCSSTMESLETHPTQLRQAELVKRIEDHLTKISNLPEYSKMVKSDASRFALCNARESPNEYYFMDPLVSVRCGNSDPGVAVMLAAKRLTSNLLAAHELSAVSNYGKLPVGFPKDYLLGKATYGESAAIALGIAAIAALGDAEICVRRLRDIISKYIGLAEQLVARQAYSQSEICLFRGILDSLSSKCMYEANQILPNIRLDEFDEMRFISHSEDEYYFIRPYVVA